VKGNREGENENDGRWPFRGKPRKKEKKLRIRWRWGRRGTCRRRGGNKWGCEKKENEKRGAYAGNKVDKKKVNLLWVHAA